MNLLIVGMKSASGYGKLKRTFWTKQNLLRLQFHFGPLSLNRQSNVISRTFLGQIEVFYVGVSKIAKGIIDLKCWYKLNTMLPQGKQR